MPLYQRVLSISVTFFCKAIEVVIVLPGEIGNTGVDSTLVQELSKCIPGLSIRFWCGLAVIGIGEAYSYFYLGAFGYGQRLFETQHAIFVYCFKVGSHSTSSLAILASSFLL